MHVVAGTLAWAEDCRHPLHRRVESADALELVETQYVELLDDGNCVSLERYAGPAAALRAAFEAEPSVQDADLVGEDPLLAYVHKDSQPASVALHTLLRTHEVALDWPVTHAGPGETRITLTGARRSVSRVVESLPDGLTFRLSRAGTFRPTSDGFVLTDRQREVLRTAVRLGYYDRPRTTSQRDVAAALDVSAGTVAEHLRKIEARVLPSLV